MEDHYNRTLESNGYNNQEQQKNEFALIEKNLEIFYLRYDKQTIIKNIINSVIKKQLMLRSSSFKLIINKYFGKPFDYTKGYLEKSWGLIMQAFNEILNIIYYTASNKWFWNVINVVFNAFAEAFFYMVLAACTVVIAIILNIDDAYRQHCEKRLDSSTADVSELTTTKIPLNTLRYNKNVNNNNTSAETLESKESSTISSCSDFT